MCGIIGLIGTNNPSLISIDALHHRGPDGSGIWISPENEPQVILGHSRLSIIDTSTAGHQPMVDSSGRYAFIFNGEIYNFIELRRELERDGYKFKSNTDTEVFFYGLIEYGPGFQLRCNGMWSFCLWDRVTGEALIGRDRFGKKPLYYCRPKDFNIAFASEMKALYPYLGKVTPSSGLDLYFTQIFDYESSDSCVIEGIERLPPGHWATFSNGKLKIIRWWNTLDHLETPPLRYEDQVERWRELFLDAVKIRMRSDVRIGTALSGGLDSSAIFCAMSHIAASDKFTERQATDWRHGFCAHYPGSSLDEANWAQVVAHHCGSKLQLVNIDPSSDPWTISKAMYQVEDPYLTLPLPMLATYRAISAAGIKVTLDGHGCDELFSGYGHLSAALNDASPWQAQEILSIIESTKTGNYKQPDNTTKAVLKWLEFNLIHRIRSARKKITSVAFKDKLRSNKSFLNDNINLQNDRRHEVYREMDSLSKVLYEITHYSILPTLLRNYDRYSMANGVEIRMPFLDWRLVTFTFGLPWTSKVGGGFSKRIFRDAMKGILPEEIRVRRDKIGWNAPMHEWLQGPLKWQVDHLINDSKQFPFAIKKNWNAFQSNTQPSYLEGEEIWRQLLPYFWKHGLFVEHQNIKFNS